jgi:peptidoglycan/xylan/chitin deacetylase (PgdA/CDA1 family)
MDYRKMIGIIVLITIIVVGTGVGIRTYIIEHTFLSEEMHDVIENYKAEDEITVALEKFPTCEPCEVITTQDKDIAIVIDGMLDKGSMQKILDLLDKYHIKATFFLEGQNASNEADLVRTIMKTQEIGNYTFNGLAEFDKKSPEYQISSLCRTQKILEMETTKSPILFRAPRTEITDEVLKAASASGIKYMVKENITLQYIDSPESANAFIKQIKPGSILAIKTGQPVYQKVDAPTKEDEHPAYDKQPTVKEISDKTKSDRIPLIQQLDYFFKALNDNNITTDYVSNFRKIKFIKEGTK